MFEARDAKITTITRPRYEYVARVNVLMNIAGAMHELDCLQHVPRERGKPQVTSESRSPEQVVQIASTSLNDKVERIAVLCRQVTAARLKQHGLLNMTPEECVEFLRRRMRNEGQ
ncbi:MAG TPA: hypothetical protein VK550_11400 [Polyangiaceae bacterium]|nr:hypothetical protein [Polyangiaceae bacterium]